MATERLSFAKRQLLKRTAESLFTTYEMIEDYEEEDIREFLDGDIVVGAVSIVSGIAEPTIVDEVVKQAKQLRKELSK